MSESHASAVNEDQVAPETESAPVDNRETDVEQGAATPSESSTEKAQDEQPESGAQKRIRELTWKQREAERRAKAAEDKLQEIERQKPEPQPQSELKIPVESEYDDLESYRRDLDAYTRQVLREEQQRGQQDQSRQQAEQEQQARLASFQDQCAAYAREHPDFLEDIQSADIEAKPHFIEYFGESDKAAEILHYLARNPEHAVKLEGMGPVAASRELARIELTLGEAVGKKHSDAPAPITDVEDTTNRDPKEIRDGMSVQEFLKARGGYRI